MREFRVLQANTDHMKRTLLSLIAIGLGILAVAQGNRIVCDETCRIEYQKTGMTAFLITGDSARNKVQTMPGGGYASVKVELPKDWDKLLEAASRE